MTPSTEHRIAVKLQRLSHGQIVVSIPGALTTALNLQKGDAMIWKLDGARLYLERA